MGNLSRHLIIAGISNMKFLFLRLPQKETTPWRPGMTTGGRSNQTDLSLHITIPLVQTRAKDGVLNILWELVDMDMNGACCLSQGQAFKPVSVTMQTKDNLTCARPRLISLEKKMKHTGCV